MKMLALLLMIFGTPISGGAQGYVAFFPEGSGTLEGNSATLYPFTFGFSRFQQIYGAGSFGGTGSQGIRLDGLYFRLDSPNGTGTAGYPTNLQINLSTTLQQVDSLSPVFNNNIGVNEQIVFGPGTIRLAAAHFPQSPQPIEPGLQIVFDQPFFFRPTDGNLLLDIRLNGSSLGIWLDAWDRNNDSVSSVLGGVTDASGVASTLGLTTIFYGQVVPEPCTYVFLALGLSSFFLFWKKRRH